LITEAGTSGVEGWRVPAQDVEAVVLRGLRQLLADRNALFDRLKVKGMVPDKLQAALARADELAAIIAEPDVAAQRELLLALIDRVAITEAELTIVIRVNALRARLGLEADDSGEHAITVLKVPVLLKRRGAEAKLVMQSQQEKAPRQDIALIKAVARGHAWFAELAQGQAASINEIARRENLTGRYVSRLTQFAFLAPDIAEAILAGRQPVDLSAETISREIDLPLDWSEQRTLLGF
jgi:hypothetical protein